MELSLDKDIVFFDIESTGLNVVKDRIIQIALIKVYKDEKADEELELMVNPGATLISEDSIRVHGITAADVASAPTFDQVAKKILDFIGDADLGGYNSNRFDIPMLMEEFARVGIEFDISHRRFIDVQKIFYKMEPRTLVGAYRYYCGKELENAHDALSDVRATLDVLKGQLDRYEATDLIDGEGGIVRQPIKNDMQVLHDFINDNTTMDATQRLRRTTDGTVVFNFGKHQGKPVGKTLYEDKQYYNWILNKEFSFQVKKMVKQLYKEYESKMQGKLNL